MKYIKIVLSVSLVLSLQAFYLPANAQEGAVYARLSPIEDQIPEAVSTGKKGWDPAPSKVYRWAGMQMEKTKSGERGKLMEGSSTHLERLKIYGTSIFPGKTLTLPDDKKNETLIIMKEGSLKCVLNGEQQKIGPGSIVMLLPGDKLKLQNDGEATATFYQMQYLAKAQVNIARGTSEGGSFAVDWEKVEYMSRQKGGRRNFFDRPTAMCDDFEMHVTTLNEGLESHPPHTHVVEEIILMVEGDIEMHIDGETPHATTGDFAFVDSEVPHRPKNIGKGQCTYFAFQWK
ncbi:MAG: cupin domain-containing protein [Cyclobacteriaceae bacterium]|nr:cupin domain-containing protein [Cyclobacteriaceae bacterium]